MIGAATILRRVADLHLARAKSEAVLRLIADITDPELRLNDTELRPNVQAQLGSDAPQSLPNAPETAGAGSPPLSPDKERVSALPKETNPQTPVRSERAKPKKTSKIEAAIATETGAEIVSEFEAHFWPQYPHKVDRPDALAAFIEARLGWKVRGKPPRSPASLPQIMAGLNRYVNDKPADRSWLNPATFLNQERFHDEPASPPLVNGNGRASHAPNDAILREIVRQFAPGDGSGGQPDDADGGLFDQPEGPRGADQPSIDLAPGAYRRGS